MNINATEETVFHEAFDKPSPEERSRYLDQACGGDVGMRKRVELLLSAYEAGQFLEAPGQGLVATGELPLSSESLGAQIGPYKLVEQIGEGGMGIVFMAQQTQPVKRKVALKVIKPGLDSRQVIARFEAERQALAMMDHPHIAKVLDAGATPTGRPYFVMELVHGIPITDYCDRDKLGTRQRLQLFVDVCRAVQHAHQKGIIHRDLKPSNVLVTLHDGVPVVKVIDFGVAKALDQELTEHTLVTQFSQVLGTPLYMSPEQAELSGLDVDTRSDVYALGVLLYELLTGTTPFDKDRLKSAGFHEMLRIIREEEPQTPSTRIETLQAAGQSTVALSRDGDPRKLSRKMRGELDWIVMKALEKDRQRRYESASSMAADVQRFLEDQPVQACPPSPLYRLKKWAGRHRRSVAAISLVVASLIVGTAISVWSAIAANAARRESDASRKQTLAATANMVSRFADYEDQLTLTPGFERKRQQVIDSALALYDELLKRHPNDPDLRFHKAKAHHIACHVCRNLDSHGDAVEHAQQAIAILEQLHAEFPANRHYQFRLGRVCQLPGCFDRAKALLSELVEKHPDAPEHSEYQTELASAIVATSGGLIQSDQEKARKLLMEAVALCDMTNRGQVVAASAHSALGDLAQLAGDKAEAQAQWIKAIDRYEQVTAESSTFWNRQQHAVVCDKLGQLLQSTQRRQEAAAQFRKAVEIHVQLATDYPTSRGATYLLEEHDQMALAQCLEPDDPRGKAKEITDELLRQWPQLAVLHYARASQLIVQGKAQEAYASFTSGMAPYRKHWDYYLFRGRCQRALNRDNEALEDFDRALELAPRQWSVHVERGDLLVKQRQFDRAVVDYTRAIEYHPGDGHVYKRRAEAAALLKVEARREESKSELPESSFPNGD